MAVRGIESSLDQDAEVRLPTWDNHWTTYDDASSFKLKTDFARSECLGGVMVWAVSHVDSSGTFSRSLSDTTIRPFTSLAGYHSDGGPSANIIVYEQHPQCMWTGCGEVCPSGYTAVSRGDSGARKGELMLDQTGWPSGQVRAALDQYDFSCQGKGGARSFCCEAIHTTTTETINPALQKWKDPLTDFLQKATCPAPDILNSTDEERGLLRRGVSGFTTTYGGGISSLNQVDYLSMTLARLLKTTLFTQLVTQMITTWNNLVTVTFPNLVFTTLGPFMQSFTLFIENGAQSVAFDLLCRMPFYEELVEKDEDEDKNPYCQGSICDAGYEPQLFQEEDNDDSSSSTQKRSSRTEDIQGQDVQSRSSHCDGKRFIVAADKICIIQKIIFDFN
ncbi:hypothetical protein EIK77_007203 [Talaromyces pinophilus]|nr:hypothetical protein EIK77_007203 [Talaromyces pinophilus]